MNQKWETETNIQKRVACGLWRLSNGNMYRGVGSSALSYCERVLKTFCNTFNCFVKFPKKKNKGSLRNPKTKTKTVSAIDGTLIEIVNWFLCLLHLFQRQFLVSCNRHCLEFFISSGDNKIDYFSRNQTYSRNSQNVVGGDLEFFWYSHRLYR